MNILEILRDNHIPTKKERPGWIQIRCPFCGKDPYLGFNLRGNYCNCWNCGSHRLGDTFSTLLRIPLRESLALVGALTAYGIPQDDRKPIPRGEYKPPSPLGALGTPHKRYLRSRGFDPVELVRLWGIQCTHGFGRLKWRIFIPIHLHGKPVSWTTRRISNKEPRYCSASPKEEKYNHKELLYGEDYCRGSVIVHEGPTDVWRTGPGAVGTLGTSFTDAQVLRLSRYGLRIICFDNERDAQRRADKLCSLLEGFPGQTYNVRLDAKDPGSASSREIAKLRSMLE